MVRYLLFLQDILTILKDKKYGFGGKEKKKAKMNDQK